MEKTGPEKSTKKPILGLCALVVVLLGISSWACIDTRPYREASRALDLPEVQARTMAVVDDVHRLHACSGQDVSEYDYSATARSCVLDAIAKSKTDLGGMASGSIAARWLRQDPSDEEMRKAGLAAIASGRADLMASKGMKYDRFRDVFNAYNQSFFLRLIYGPRSASNGFDNVADDLDRVEYALLLPDVAQKQSDWRQKAYATQ